MKILNNKWLYIGIGIVLVLLLVKKCEQEPKIIIKEKITYKDRIDTIKVVEIGKAKTVYVDRYKTIKGQDSIVYRDRPNDSTIVANQYDTELKSNNALAKLKITTTGQLLDVSGTIEYKEKIVERDIIKTKAKSGLFIVAESSVNPVFENVGLGLDYQFKNTVIMGVAVNYDNRINQTYISAKVGIRIF